MRAVLPLFLLALGCRSAPDPWRPPLSVTWDRNMLRIRGPGIPGGEVPILYLEAYRRSGSTDRDWRETVIPHRTEKVSASPDGTALRLRCRVEGGVEVEHEIRAGEGEVDFRVEAVHRGTEYVDAVWVQPCIRVDRFTGGDKESYVSKCFIFLDGRPVFLDRTLERVAPRARYTPGQVFVPPGIDRRDVNPRPLSPDVPSNGLIGCVSADGTRLLATAWEPYQELFQGVIACIHSDFRLGGLRPGETRRARGKVYLMENDVDRLLARYRRDCPESAGLPSR